MYDEAEEHRIEKDTVAFKNTFLVPLYTSVRAIITKLKSSELDEIYEDYQLTLHGLKQSLGVQSSEFIKRREEAEDLFLRLIRKVKKDLDNPKIKLFRLREKLILIVNLLLKWREYTRILNMGYGATRKMMDETKTKPGPTPNSKTSAKAITQEALAISRKEKQDYIDGVDESSFEARINEIRNTDNEKPKSESLDDFLDQYKDIIMPYMGPEQIRQVQKDFARIREAQGSIYGITRNQPQVTSDEFFKSIMESSKLQANDQQSELDRAKFDSPDSLFNLLNLVYKNVSSKDKRNEAKRRIKRPSKS